MKILSYQRRRVVGPSEAISPDLISDFRRVVY